MCLNAARLPGRTDKAGSLRPLAEQDRSRWDRELIARGVKFLELSANGADLSEYHIEAAIASIHANAASTAETDWRSIVCLYDVLMAQHPSPVVALNRAIAVAQSESAERGLQEIAAISDRERLAEYPFYFAAQGELELTRGLRNEAKKHFRAALTLARNPMERRYYEQRLAACG
jgi:RNA polymerase sigma-70 factor (ECF subfamily)